MQKRTLPAWWQNLQHHAHAHHKAYHRFHHVTHVSYLTLVAGHGPYSIAATAMLIVLIIGYVLKLEDL